MCICMLFGLWCVTVVAFFCWHVIGKIHNRKIYSCQLYNIFLGTLIPALHTPLYGMYAIWKKMLFKQGVLHHPSEDNYLFLQRLENKIFLCLCPCLQCALSLSKPKVFLITAVFLYSNICRSVSCQTFNKCLLLSFIATRTHTHKHTKWSSSNELRLTLDIFACKYFCTSANS